MVKLKFKELISTMNLVHSKMKTQAIRAVNTSLTLRNWCFGFYIFEFEQGGQDRAQYGTNLLLEIEQAISPFQIPNTNERELRRYRQFYITYPHFHYFIFNDGSIRGILPPELHQSGIIRGTASPELDIPIEHINRLCLQLSYSHFVELIRLDTPIKRLFYELEALKSSWSVKELKRQIGSLLYERTGLSSKQENLLGSFEVGNQKPAISDLIRDPYIFEFVGLKYTEVYSEKELEGALLENLTNFLLELGKGFCLEARQKRILIDNEHYFVDMVFYHRILHCHVLIELKTERFHHSHASQLNMYLEYFKKYEMSPTDNLPIGILLCTDKDSEHVEFATAGMDDKLFVAKYLLELPDKKALQNFIRKELGMLKN